jgi:HD superfamily phosphohydrolase YqeK
MTPAQLHSVALQLQRIAQRLRADRRYAHALQAANLAAELVAEVNKAEKVNIAE